VKAAQQQILLQLLKQEDAVVEVEVVEEAEAAAEAVLDYAKFKIEGCIGEV
jgi:hypothetical protein